MRLQIKTLNQKSLQIDIDVTTQRVYDLKKELSHYPDVGVKPELQKLIYGGKILANDDLLSAYNIDVKKFLVVMVLKQPVPVEERGTTTTTAEAPSTSKTTTTTAAEQTKTTAAAAEQQSPKHTGAVAKEIEFKTPAVPASLPVAAGDLDTTPPSTTETLVNSICNMGYPEVEVRRALRASFNNPERAIEYLIEGIPTSPSTPEGGGDSYTDAEADELSPFEVFRSDPLFRNLRRAIQQHPELIDSAIQQVGEANPSILSLINENQHEFLRMLVDGSDDEDDEDDYEASGI